MPRKQPVPPDQPSSSFALCHPLGGGTVEDARITQPDGPSAPRSPITEASSKNEAEVSSEPRPPLDAGSVSALCSLFQILDEWERKEVRHED